MSTKQIYVDGCDRFRTAVEIVSCSEGEVALQLRDFRHRGGDVSDADGQLSTRFTNRKDVLRFCRDLKRELLTTLTKDNPKPKKKKKQKKKLKIGKVVVTLKIEEK